MEKERERLNYQSSNYIENLKRLKLGEVSDRNLKGWTSVFKVFY
jgi:hypothetical protein